MTNACPVVLPRHDPMTTRRERFLRPIGDDQPRISDEDVRLIGLYADGLPIEAIARRLDLSERTVRRRTRALCDRLGARAAIQVVAWAARRGLI
jgi:DNA-binding NarL/FixJ family response regulator